MTLREKICNLRTKNTMSQKRFGPYLGSITSICFQMGNKYLGFGTGQIGVHK